MVYYKTDEEVEIIRQNCLLVSKTLTLVGNLIKPGITGSELDIKAEEFIRSHEGAVPGFKDYNGFPSTLCISKNEAVVHGIPNDEEFIEGDIVSVDCGVLHHGYYGDAAYTFALNGVEGATLELLEVTKTSLNKAIEQAIVGKRLGDIGFAVQHFCEKDHNYGVVRELVGHGVGRNLHESPEVPNYGKRGRGQLLKDGLVIAIEPMVNAGTRDVRQDSDGWTIISKDRKPSAHFEHTVVVRKDKADILSDHQIIEEAVKNNPYLEEIRLKN